MDSIFTIIFGGEPFDARVEDVDLGPVEGDDPGGGNNNCVVA